MESDILDRCEGKRVEHVHHAPVFGLTMITDISRSGNIMTPPFASTSMKLKSTCFAAGSASAAADARDAENKNPAAEKGRHFMNVVGV